MLRNVLLFSLITSCFATLMCILALYDEVLTYCRISSLTGCFNGITQEGVGAMYSMTTAKSCNTGAQCTCADTNSFCYDFTLTGGGSDCSAIYINYANYLFFSSIVLVALCGAMISFFCVTIMSITSDKIEEAESVGVAN